MQAKRAFEVHANAHALDEYKSHYTKTGKCLMLIERRYVDSVSPGAPGGTEPLPRCELTPSLDEEKKCATREEFDAFVNGYLKE
jgi:hypothetical protein